MIIMKQQISQHRLFPMPISGDKRFNHQKPLVAIIAISLPSKSCPLSEKSAKLLEKGIKYLQNREYTKAVLIFEKIIRNDPGHSQAHFYLGRAAHFKHHIFPHDELFSQAIFLYKKAIELEPTNSKYHAYLGQAQYDYACEKNQKAHLLLSLESSAKALTLDSKNALAYFFRAKTYHKLALFSQTKSEAINYVHLAIEDCTKAIQFNPTVEIYIDRMNFYFLLGQKEDALKDLAIINDIYSRLVPSTK